jgi:hypothetical protein
MTRTEFDRQFSARMDNTEGFNVEQLATLNSLVFDMVESLDLDDRQVKSGVDAAFADACCNYAIAKLS